MPCTLRHLRWLAPLAFLLAAGSASAQQPPTPPKSVPVPAAKAPDPAPKPIAKPEPLTKPEAVTKPEPLPKPVEQAQMPNPAPLPAPAPAPAKQPASDAGGTQPVAPAEAGEEIDPGMARVAACKEQALARLKQVSPSIEDIFIDIDGLTIAESTGKLGDTDVKGVIMGEAYIQRDLSDRANRFLCLTGKDDAVLFTFFTER